MKCGDMFHVVEPLKVLRKAMVVNFGEAFAETFDDTDGCIGVTLDFLADKKKPAGMSTKEYAAPKKKQCASSNAERMRPLRRSTTRREGASISSLMNSTYNLNVTIILCDNTNY
jgi:hypothetical protein